MPVSFVFVLASLLDTIWKDGKSIHDSAHPQDRLVKVKKRRSD